MRPRPEFRCLAAVLAVSAILAVAHVRAEDPLRPMTGAGSPSEVLSRLQTAVENRDPQGYADCLADTFRFTPYSGVVAAYPDIKWKQWHNAQEFEFVRWLCSPARKAELHLLDEVLDRGIQSGGVSDWEIVYTLLVDGTAFKGRATLHFVKIRQLWYLESWIDTRQEPWQGLLVATSGAARASFTR